MIWSVIWYWLLAVFTLADIITTRICIALGGHEANPFMAGYVDQIVEVKIGYLCLMAVIMAGSERMHKGSGWLPVAGGSCITFTAVLSNILQFMTFSLSCGVHGCT